MTSSSCEKTYFMVFSRSSSNNIIPSQLCKLNSIHPRVGRPTTNQHPFLLSKLMTLINPAQVEPQVREKRHKSSTSSSAQRRRYCRLCESYIVGFLKSNKYQSTSNSSAAKDLKRNTHFESPQPISNSVLCKSPSICHSKNFIPDI